jgi:hypothetical protein
VHIFFSINSSEAATSTTDPHISKMGEVLFEHELWRRRRMKAERETTGKAWMRDAPEQQFQEEYEEDLSQRGGRSRKRRAREWRED